MMRIYNFFVWPFSIFFYTLYRKNGSSLKHICWIPRIQIRRWCVHYFHSIWNFVLKQSEQTHAVVLEFLSKKMKIQEMNINISNNQTEQKSVAEKRNHHGRKEVSFNNGERVIFRSVFFKLNTIKHFSFINWRSSRFSRKVSMMMTTTTTRDRYHQPKIFERFKWM